MGFFDKLKEWFHFGEEKESEAALELKEPIKFEENSKPEPIEVQPVNVAESQSVNVEVQSDSQPATLADLPNPNASAHPSEPVPLE